MWKQQGSKLVPRVCEALGILPPKVSVEQLPDEESMELLRMIQALSDEQRQALRVLLKNQFRVQ
jgi:DNA-directed RNA polymerase specialized sigma24 family protein